MGVLEACHQNSSFQRFLDLSYLLPWVRCEASKSSPLASCQCQHLATRPLEFTICLALGEVWRSVPHPGKVLQAPGIHVIHPSKDVLVVSAQFQELQLRARRQLCARAAVADQKEEACYQPCNAQHLHQL